MARPHYDTRHGLMWISQTSIFCNSLIEQYNLKTEYHVVLSVVLYVYFLPTLSLYSQFSDPAGFSTGLKFYDKSFEIFVNHKTSIDFKKQYLNSRETTTKMNYVDLNSPPFCQSCSIIQLDCLFSFWTEQYKVYKHFLLTEKVKSVLYQEIIFFFNI